MCVYTCASACQVKFLTAVSEKTRCTRDASPRQPGEKTAMPTSFWLAVLHAEDLGVVGLHLQDLLQAVEAVNPAGGRNGHTFSSNAAPEVSSWGGLEKLRPLSLPAPPPQHPVAVPRRQVLAVGAHADAPDA